VLTELTRAEQRILTLTTKPCNGCSWQERRRRQTFMAEDVKTEGTKHKGAKHLSGQRNGSKNKGYQTKGRAELNHRNPEEAGKTEKERGAHRRKNEANTEQACVGEGSECCEACEEGMVGGGGWRGSVSALRGFCGSDARRDEAVGRTPHNRGKQCPCPYGGMAESRFRAVLGPHDVAERRTTVVNNAHVRMAGWRRAGFALSWAPTM
jgi:hypothetical protein